ncbi:MAG: hypothetical protein JSR17_00005 [Proteobacteria bacterium]|nr:hypothetical protein [Pseudomonadota bacterium]
MGDTILNPGTGKFNLNDLFGPWSPTTIKHIISKIDYQIDESALQKEGVQRQHLLTNPGNSKVYLSQILLELSLQGQHGVDETTAQNERFIKNKISFLIASSIRKSLNDEALATFFRREHLKEAMEAYRKYILARSDENYTRMLNESDLERAKLEEAMNKLIAAEYERMRTEAENAWDFHNQQVSHHEQRISAATHKAMQIIDEHAEEYKSALDTAMAKSPAAEAWQAIPDEQRKQFAKEILKEDFHNEINIEHTKNMITVEEQRLQQLKGKLIEIEQGGKTSINSSPTQAIQVSPEYRSVTPQRELEKVSQRELARNPEYKALIKEISACEAKIVNLKQEHKKLEDKKANTEEQVNRIGENVFGAAKIAELKRVDPDFHKIVHKAEVQQLRADISEKLKEHKVEIVNAKKTIAHHEGEKEKVTEKTNRDAQLITSITGVDARNKIKAKRL